jgi:hypothetical protein
MAEGFAGLPEGGKPVLMGAHAPPPLPEALGGMQRGRGGGLGLEPASAPRLLDDSRDWGPLMRLSPGLDDQPGCPRLVGHPGPQAWRHLLLPPRGAHRLGGRPGRGAPAP